MVARRLGYFCLAAPCTVLVNDKMDVDAFIASQRSMLTSGPKAHGHGCEYLVQVAAPGRAPSGLLASDIALRFLRGRAQLCTSLFDLACHSHGSVCSTVSSASRGCISYVLPRIEYTIDSILRRAAAARIVSLIALASSHDCLAVQAPDSCLRSQALGILSCPCCLPWFVAPLGYVELDCRTLWKLRSSAGLGCLLDGATAPTQDCCYSCVKPRSVWLLKLNPIGPATSCRIANVCAKGPPH